MAEHVCPPWVGRLLASPIRKFFQNPDKILGPYIKEGMTVLEPGCAMGFFSLPAARMAGPKGKVICIDLQDAMLEALKKRAVKARLDDRLELRSCSSTSLKVDDLKETVDFTFAIAVVHEVPDQDNFFHELYQTLKPGRLFLFAEPKGHITQEAFDQSLSLAKRQGFAILNQGIKYGAVTAVLKK